MPEVPGLVAVSDYDLFVWMRDRGGWMQMSLAVSNDEEAIRYARREAESYKHVRLYKVTRDRMIF